MKVLLLVDEVRNLDLLFLLALLGRMVLWGLELFLTRSGYVEITQLDAK